jgi:hypothetical protein
LAAQPDLEDQARIFASEVTALLNNTISNGVRISSVVTPRGDCVLGRGVRPKNFEPKRVACTLGAGKPTCWLLVAQSLSLDEPSTYLQTAQAIYALYTTEADEEEPLFHLDYLREPDNVYPQAHLQVDGTSDAFETLRSRCGLDPKTKLGHLHFPVGPKRFRPTLEDVIEFLIVEGFCAGMDGWRDAVSASRRDWYVKQLRAAMRREEAVVRQLVEEMDNTNGWLPGE